MPDLILSAFSQSGLLLVGSFLLIIGISIIGNVLYWRLFATYVEATIIGVREKPAAVGEGKLYFPVYRYSFTDGETFEETSSGGSSIRSGKETGRVVTLAVFRNDPTNVRVAGKLGGLFFGALFGVPGALLVRFALTSFPFTIYTTIVLALIALGLAAKIKKIIIPKSQRLAPAAWKAARREKRRQEMEALPLVNMEDVPLAPENVAVVRQKRGFLLFLSPAFMVLMLACFGGSVYFGDKIVTFEKHGLRAEGIVLHNIRKMDLHFPVVAFRPEHGKRTRFQDILGTPERAYQMNDHVTVLYLKDAPAENAIIDRGPWNWALPGSLFGLGILLGLVFIGIRGSVRAEEAV